MIVPMLETVAKNNITFLGFSQVVDGGPSRLLCHDCGVVLGVELEFAVPVPVFGPSCPEAEARLMDDFSTAVPVDSESSLAPSDGVFHSIL